jgi:hypothetical protein
VTNTKITLQPCQDITNQRWSFSERRKDRIFPTPEQPDSSTGLQANVQPMQNIEMLNYGLQNQNPLKELYKIQQKMKKRMNGQVFE